MAWRAISDSVPFSESLASVSDGAERLYWRMVAVSDWWGRLEGKPRKVRAKAIPLLKRSDLQVARMLDELQDAGRVLLYEHENEVYIQLVDFDKHQPADYIRKRGKGSRFPEPPANGQQAWRFPELLRPSREKASLEVEDRREEKSRKPKNLAIAKRENDELWDVFDAEIGQVATKAERGRRNKALKDLRGIGCTPDQLRAAIAAYRRRWSDIDVTETAIAANWSTISRPNPNGRKLGPAELMALANQEPLQ